jgi:hypothetical protein
MACCKAAPKANEAEWIIYTHGIVTTSLLYFMITYKEVPLKPWDNKSHI